jgi:geranylgeranyl pyrophosphate synthase
VLDHKKKQLEITLQETLSDITHQDSLINDIVFYNLFPAGKRLRSLLTLLMYEMLGGTKGNIYRCAIVPEIIHVATLMLDDLPCMDDSAYRRDKPSCHKKFGDANTILAAFGLAAESFRILSDNDNFDGINADQSLLMLHEVSQKIGFNGLIGGQIADLNQGVSLSKKVTDDQKLHYITANKTAVLFEVCALIACCLAEATQEDKEHMIAYAHNVGLALQIFDDLHDSNEDKGLSFTKMYGFDAAKELLHEKLYASRACITHTNEQALLLKELPTLLLEIE